MCFSRGKTQSLQFLLTFCAVSTMCAQGWQTVSGNMPQFNAISAVDSLTCWVGGSRAFIVRVVNGTTVQWRDAGLESGNITALYARSDALAWAGSDNGKLYQTTDGGLSWSKLFQHPAGYGAFFNGVYFWDDDLGIAWGDPVSYPNSGPFLIMRTTDGGSSWSEIISGVPSVTNQYGITQRHDAADGYFWFATASNLDTTLSRVIFRTKNKGLTWDTLSIPPHFGNFTVSFSDSLNGLIAGTLGKIARTTDGGLTWDYRRDGVGYGPLEILKGSQIGYLQGYFDIALGYSPIFKTTDLGQSWTMQSRPTTSGIIAFELVNANYTWASGFNHLIMRTRTGGSATSVAFWGEVNEAPAAFELSQNFPNPFNPTTSIKYRLFSSGLTRIVIYDELGRSVRTLFDEVQREGWHVAVWDGTDDSNSRVATGVYFYSLQSAERAEARKMILLK